MILKHVAEDQANQAIAYGNLGIVYQTCSDLGRAVEYGEKSLKLFQQIGAKKEIERV